MNAASSRSQAAWHAPVSAARTSPGAVRPINEDRFIERNDIGLWSVADGMGGHEQGEFAASQTVEALSHLPAFTSGYGLLTATRETLERTNSALIEHARALGATAIVGATVVVLMVFDGHFACLWAGDSRAYRLRHGRLEQITRDHSVVQALVDRHAMTLEQARALPGAHLITRALGASQYLDLELAHDSIEPGDVFLLCSDGLTGALSHDELAGLSDAEDLDAAADALLAQALAHGARDNVTLILVRP